MKPQWDLTDAWAAPCASFIQPAPPHHGTCLRGSVADDVSQHAAVCTSRLLCRRAPSLFAQPLLQSTALEKGFVAYNNKK